MKVIKTQIETLMYENASDFEISKVLKQDIKEYFGTLDESFAQSSGKGFLVQHTRKIDTLIQMVYKVAMRSMFDTYMPMKNTLPITLLALGSYGREQLCVYSDIDLMIVYKEVPGYNTKEMIEKILYILWDAGLKLGHRVHEIKDLFEVSKTDITIKTSMIESRFIEGSKQLWDQTQNELYRIRKDEQKEFIKAKIDEMETLHQKYPMTMEPNLKEGDGGFRNANLVYWIGNILYGINRIEDIDNSIISEKAYKEFWKALEFLFKVRSALHLVAGKKEDRLRLELIPFVAKYLGYGETQQEHTQFSRKVISSLKTIKLYSYIWIEALTHYYEKSTMLCPSREDLTFPELIQELTQAPKEQFPVHPTFLNALISTYRTPDIEEHIYVTLRQLFSHPQSHLILKTLLDSRRLGYTIPYLKKVINLPQFDGYHQYAVGIHTIKAIEALENIQKEDIRLLYHNLSAEEQLFIKVVVLIHDAGKGRKRPHSEIGTVLFKSLAQKLNFSQEHIHMGKNLVLYHTLMSTTAQQVDLHSEKAILKFSSHFPTQKELDFIYILTYADMNGVGKKIYNDFNAHLIATLYHQASLALSNENLLYETTRRVKKEKRLQRLQSFQTLNRSLQKKILGIHSDLFFIKNTPQQIINICKQSYALNECQYTISNNQFLTIEIFRTKNFDVSYLLYKLSRLDIVQMDIYKLFLNVKYFKLIFNESISEGEYSHLHEIIEAALTKEHTLNLKKPIIAASKIKTDCKHSKEHATLQLNCPNQKGLISYVIQVMDKFNVDISSAKIHTKMNRVNDLFLIEKNGNFCNNTRQIIKELTE